MPIYTYHCDNCGVQFERTQKFTDQPLTCCPECNKKALRKIYTPVGIVFKGSGFYSTDNRSPSGQSARAKEDTSEEKKTTEKGSEKKAESDTSSTKSDSTKSDSTKSEKKD